MWHDRPMLPITQYAPNWDAQWKQIYDGDGQRPLIDNKNENNMWASQQGR